MKDIAPKLSAEEYDKNFSDIYPAMTDAEAMAESSRCLFCYDAPCINACPTHIDIPKFIKQINTRNLKGSARTILAANLFGASCARVCPVEALCEGDCVMNDLHKKPIEIGRLQRYATDHLFGRGEHTKLFTKGAANGKRVAVVGAGPAGVSCAGYLAQLGYQATIYDARPKPGGLNTYAIAEYKMTMETALKEIEIVQALGVVIRQGVQVGKDVSVEQLQKENDAVFIGVGLGKTTPLGVEGEALPGVIDALSFIEQVKTRNFDRMEVGRHVVVVGAGNTAVDATTQAKRLGADKVIMMYRRGEEEMPAYDYEFSLAKQDGIEFMWFTAPKRILGNGRVEKIECVRTKARERGMPPPSQSSGDGRSPATLPAGAVGGSAKRPSPPEVIPGSEFFVECDMIIKALGQAKQLDLLNAFNVKMDARGRVVVDPATNQTSNPKFFAGGDCVNGGKEVVNAVADGKRAAAGIHRMLFGRTAPFAGMGVPGPIRYKA